MYVRLLRRVAVLGCCVAVAVGGLVVGAAAPAAAHPGVPSSRYDPNAVSWTSVRDARTDDFERIVRQRRDAGEMLIDLDIDTGNKFGGVFQRNSDGRDWVFQHGLTFLGLNQAINELRGLNMRLVDVEPALVNGTHQWGGLWVKNVEGYDWNVRFDNFSVSAFANSERAAGRMLIDVDTYLTTSSGCCLASAISVRNAENRDWSLSMNLTGSEFHAVFEAVRGTHRPLVADSVKAANGQLFSAVWVANRAGRGMAIHRGMTIDQWAAKWRELFDAGFRVINFERYETANGTRYLGVWRQNT